MTRENVKQTERRSKAIFDEVQSLPANKNTTEFYKTKSEKKDLKIAKKLFKAELPEGYKPKIIATL